MDREGIDSLLEMHLHGELPPALRRKAEKLLATPEGKRRLDEIRESDRRILEELPPARMAESIRRKLSSRSASPASGAVRRTAWLGWGAGASLAALGIALFAIVERRPEGPAVSLADSALTLPVLPEDRSTPASAAVDRAAKAVLGTEAAAPGMPAARDEIAMTNPVDDGIRTKGGELRRLRLHLRKTDGGGAQVLRDGDTVPKAALLQVSLAAGPLTWTAVVSVDGAGQATLHLPESGDSAAALADETAAPHSFQLDDAPGFERFFLITSSHRFSLDEALALARRSGGADPTRKGWNIESLKVAKP